MSAKIGRNAPCSCGSGKKWKKCCGAARASAGFNADDRLHAYAALESYTADALGYEDDLAYEELLGQWADYELPDSFEAMMEAAFDAYMYFDRPLSNGRLVVDALIEEHGGLPAGVRAFAQVMRSTAMHVWEVVDVVPGAQLRLRDVLEGEETTVRERTASRTLSRHEWVAARVVPRGPSGEPEIEAGMLPIPALYRDAVRAQLSQQRTQFLKDHPGKPLSDFYKRLAPFFVDVWAGALLEPQLPELHNTDGEALLLTEVTYEVLDAEALRHGLDNSDDLEVEQEGANHWHWTGKGQQMELVSLGRVELVGNRLKLSTNSAERAERGRALLEALAGSSLRYRSTAHEDPSRRIREELRQQMLGEQPSESTGPGDAIPKEVQEALVLDHYARHYRSWLDEAIPALEGMTPRQAARTPAQRPKLIELLRGLERDYERSLKSGAPAYDPSWMWAELAVSDEKRAQRPSVLAHERIAELIPEAEESTRKMAEAERSRSGFDDHSTVLSPDQCRASLELRRVVSSHERTADDESVLGLDSATLATYLWAMANFELHRRKSFWVDESLSFMLAHTELDALGRELRVPFPAFAIAFTDRHVLSLGERLLAGMKDSPAAGHLLRILTVYVLEETRGDDRQLSLVFALDPMGADAPALVNHDFPLSDNAPVQAHVDAISPNVEVEGAVQTASPTRGLLTVVLNAILYATSPGVEPEVRSLNAKRSHGAASPVPQAPSSDEIYFLPGAIEISTLRRYQALDRLPDGREILRRYMVRGHWRRASKHWSDQRPRWIRPYWKGPDIAAVIERAYRLKP